MGGRDQSQVKIKFKKFEKVKSIPKDVPESHNDDTMNTHRNKRSRSGDWVINKNNPKVAVEETGGRGIQVDIKSGECQQQTPDIIYIHV